MPDGSPIGTLRFLGRSDSDSSVQTMQYFSEWLAELGIQAEVRTAESSELTNIILDGEFDAFQWGWYVEPDPNSMLDYMTCAQLGNWSDSWYCDEEYDQMHAAVPRARRRAGGGRRRRRRVHGPGAPCSGRGRCAPDRVLAARLTSGPAMPSRGASPPPPDHGRILTHESVEIGVVAVGGASDRLQPALPRQWYVDAGHFARERDAALFGSWFCVGRAGELGLDLPERLAVVDVVGESLLLTSDADGRLHGAYNVCRHRGSQIVPVEPGTSPTPGALPARSLRCPYHSWTYALDGTLLRAPHCEGIADFDPAAFALTPVGVDTWRGWCFVHLDAGRAASLADDMAGFTDRLRRYPMERLVSGRHFSYDVAANYKVLAENYNECYHCGPVHPELSRLVPDFAGGGTDLEWDDGVPHRDGAWTFTVSGTTTRRPFAELDEHERTRHKGELVHPNLWLSCAADHVAAFVLWPLAHDRTRVDCDLLFDPCEVDRADFDPDDAGDLWDLVNRQDWAVCESVQRGMTSRGWTDGWFAPMEDWSADVRRWLLPKMEGGRG